MPTARARRSSTCSSAGCSAATRSARSCAKQLGYYEQEGIELAIQPGGPNIDGVAVVASGRFEVGQVSSSPSLMLAASQDIPIKCFAAGAQKHPYASSR